LLRSVAGEVFCTTRKQLVRGVVAEKCGG